MGNYFLDFLFDESNDSANAICINDVFFTYKELKQKTSSIVSKINQLGIRHESIGVYIGDNVETYASIIAIWYTGNKYIPLHPTYPPSRIEHIIEISNIQLILSTDDFNETIKTEIPVLSPQSLPLTDLVKKDNLYVYEKEDVVYILFTSGSTGTPKGVQINFKNLNAFLQNLDNLKLELPKGSGYLQMFELTFDLSIVSILLPLMNSGVLYHVSMKSVKYLEIYRLLEEYPIQFAIIVPSVLSMLKPHFDSIQLPNLKYVALSGEAVPLELTQLWQCCCPNAKMFNFYGPTECTIFCTYYEIPKKNIGSQNGIVSIGKVNESCLSLFLNEDGERVSTDEKALLWIGGEQVSPGYLGNDDLNNKLFMKYGDEHYYNTGDIVIRNEAQEIFYLGRKDSQVKINGYRIELSEVEFNASKALNNNSFVLAVNDSKSFSLKLILFMLKTGLSNTLISAELKKTLPDYMLPSLIIQLDEFPLNTNGKLDRNQLKAFYERQS